MRYFNHQYFTLTSSLFRNSILLFFVLFLVNLGYGQENNRKDKEIYIPPHRENVSLELYEKWVKRIYKFTDLLTDKDLPTKNRIVLELNITSGYRMLGEPTDMILDRLPNILPLDSSFACQMILLNNRNSKGFGNRHFTKAEPKWRKLCEVCEPFAKKGEEEAQRKRKEEEERIDPLLLKELNLLSERDQKYRSLIGEARKVHGSQSEVVQSLISKQNHLDSLNVLLVDSIITRYNGYISKDILGNTHSNDLLLIALHCNSISFLNKHYPMFKEQAKKLEINRNLFVILTDRYHMQKTGKQVFGTQKKWNEVLQINETAPLYEAEKLVELKKELGF